MYRKVLLCYDGTRASRDALREGAELAGALKAETHVLVVSNLFNVAVKHGMLSEASLDVEQSQTESLLNEGLAWLRERGIEATAHVKSGAPIDVIPGMARELGADLVVVGHVCRTPFSRWWTGGENVALSDRLRCGLLVVCGGNEPRS
jgi:nucleotide-binding universal stress UspA family protein